MEVQVLGKHVAEGHAQGLLVEDILRGDPAAVEEALKGGQVPNLSPGDRGAEMSPGEFAGQASLALGFESVRGREFLDGSRLELCPGGGRGKGGSECGGQDCEYIPFAFLLYLWPDGRTALMLSLPGSFLGGMYLGPTFAMTQSLVPPHMRATASAILLFVINLIGLGLGPQAVGILSDLLHGEFGIESLRYAMLSTVVVFAAWSVVHYTLGARTLRRDLDAKNHLGP